MIVIIVSSDMLYQIDIYDHYLILYINADYSKLLCWTWTFAKLYINLYNRIFEGGEEQNLQVYSLFKKKKKLPEQWYQVFYDLSQMIFFSVF